jgi:hypothetical protein
MRHLYATGGKYAVLDFTKSARRWQAFFFNFSAFTRHGVIFRSGFQQLKKNQRKAHQIAR